MQTALAKGWGATPSELDVQDLARKIEDRQPVGSHPEFSVIAAEKRAYLRKLVTQMMQHKMCS